MVKNKNPKHNWKFYLSPHDAWKAMHNDCIAAKTSIYFEQYIFENDEIGNKFLELFIKKLSQGVTVTLVCDGFGSRSLRDSSLLKKFVKNGGNFHFYNALNSWIILTPWRWLPRTHAKTLLIDSNIAYVGGICLAKRMEFWRDIDIRMVGPIKNDILYSIDQKNVFKKIAGSTKNFYYVRSRSFILFRTIYRELTKAIIEAKHYIYITTAFLVPSHYFLKLLIAAKRRGLEVVVIIPQYSEIKLADFMALYYVQKLLQAGIKVFFYDKTILHSKIVIIDDLWATVGSTNMDILSFFYNKEANVIITDPKAIHELKKIIIHDIKHSKEFTTQILDNISWRKKILGMIMRIFKIFFKS